MSMLFYKAWLESRMRFMISAAVILALCLVIILFANSLRPQMRPAISYTGYIYFRVYAGFVRGIFVMLALILGLGGLQGERGHNTIGFTLSLPVSRFHLVAARALTGLLELVLLALLPAILVPGLSAAIGESYPWTQSLAFFSLWVFVGWAVFAAAFLASSSFSNEYSALTTALVAFYVYPLIVARTPALRHYPLHIHYIMNGTGMPYFNPHTDLFMGPFPWAIVSGVFLVSGLLIGSAALVTQRTDFF